MTERQTPNVDAKSVLLRNEGEGPLIQAETRAHLQAVCRVKDSRDETLTARVTVDSPEMTFTGVEDPEASPRGWV